eukprot:scaffold16043_cov115-Isochrysis_galbana.AAC.16
MPPTRRRPHPRPSARGGTGFVTASQCGFRNKDSTCELTFWIKSTWSHRCSSTMAPAQAGASADDAVGGHPSTSRPHTGCAEGGRRGQKAAAMLAGARGKVGAGGDAPSAQAEGDAAECAGGVLSASELGSTWTTDVSLGNTSTTSKCR